ncbi:IclR family transcriptional regulator [Aquipuribacter nitratireducens]|uniref:IclR family transcriptional regulator n=1 Tax=Aquipuribacter nitratireducens TaxID=650104 RepID=A0ABW0GQ83_9MICO
MPKQHATAVAASPVPDASPSTSQDGAGGVRSVQRALDILGLLTEDRPQITIREIVDATGLAKTTVIRLTQTLVQCGLLWATSSGYTAGPGLWRWAHLARNAWELPPESRRRMREMADQQQETVNLYVRRDVHRVCIAQEESPRALRHVVRVGDELPLWGGASAKVLLRDAAPDLLERVVATAPAGSAGLDAASLGAAVAQVAAAGYAVSHGERESGVSAVAVPLLQGDGTVVGALSLSGATARFTPERVEQFVTALRAAADAMTGRGTALTAGGAG